MKKITIKERYSENYKHYDFSDNPRYTIAVRLENVPEVERRIARFFSHETNNLILSDIAEYERRNA